MTGLSKWNGAMWMALGSHVEPIYPPREGHAFGHRELAGIRHVSGVSHSDDMQNELAPIAERYPHVLVPARAGDVVFFHGHVLHRSKQNATADRFRRAFVSHYCNARSFTQWGADKREPGDPLADWCVDPITGMTNGSHILARGDSFHWDGSVPHRIENHGPEVARLLVARTPPGFLNVTFYEARPDQPDESAGPERPQHGRPASRRLLRALHSEVHSKGGAG